MVAARPPIPSIRKALITQFLPVTNESAPPTASNPTTLATMLENPRNEKVTTAALAARLGVSEAALYRHFASKAQMFEGLIEFIESSLFGLINRITSDEKSGVRQIEAIVGVLLGFAQKNRGMTRVLIGDALVYEDEKLQARINQLHDRLEAAIRQAIRFGITLMDGSTGLPILPGHWSNLLRLLAHRLKSSSKISSSLNSAPVNVPVWN